MIRPAYLVDVPLQLYSQVYCMKFEFVSLVVDASLRLDFFDDSRFQLKTVIFC